MICREFRPFTAMPGAPSSAAAKAARQGGAAKTAGAAGAAGGGRSRAAPPCRGQGLGAAGRRQQNGARNGGEMVDFYGFL